MPEEAAQAPEETQDTSATEAAPVTGTPAAEDSEYTPERARGLHAELTKAQQELANLRAVDEALRDPERGVDLLTEQYGWQFGNSEDETVPGDEGYDPIAALEQRQAALEEQAQQQQAQEGMNRFNADLDALLAEKDLTLSQRDRFAVWAETAQRGDNHDVLKSVVDEIATERTALKQAALDEYIKSKRAPHVSKGGTGATETPFREDMSLDERIAAAQERARLMSSDS